MSLRFKIIFFTIAFLATSMALGVGAYYTFIGFGGYHDTLVSQVEKDAAYDKLSNSVIDFVTAVEGWQFTHDPAYRDAYSKSLPEVRQSAGKLQGLIGDASKTEAFKTDFDDLVVLAQQIMESDRTLRTRDSESLFKLFGVQKSTVLMRTNEIHRDLVESTGRRIIEGEAIRTSLTFYLVLLISFALLSSGFLVILMRRLLGEPFRVLLEATGRVASGDLGHRIHSARKDEFGTISNRFDNMVENLQQSDYTIKSRLKETELFLEIASIAGSTTELKQALDRIVDVMASKMDREVSGVFLKRQARKSFVLEACNVRKACHEIELNAESGDYDDLVKMHRHIVLGAGESFGELTACGEYADTLLLVPIVRDNECTGILMIGKKGAGTFGDDEVNTARILAYTIGSAVKNIELYEATRKQLGQLRIVYELSKSLTSVFDQDEILRTITKETSKLLRARGCVIRLLEDGMLRAVSFSGPMEEMDAERTVPVGEGIAGWVAKEGTSLLVDDVSKIPAEMRKSVTAIKSAIAVPLKREGAIIGTLGLYDKLDEAEQRISFSPDDLAVAEGFALLSAIAIDKSRMQERQLVSEAAIVKAKKRMDLLFESVQGGIITLDEDYQITSANKYIEKWVDSPVADLISKSALDVFHGKGRICPHCVAKATFESGDINSITQASGLNYAELTSYPVLDENNKVKEAVVFIQDITERVLYQEEIMGLYREVMQTKEYMESLIENSADAIATTDLEGIVKSWNPAAETVYGFKEDEVMGKFLPFVPESLTAFEKENIERIKKGEVLKLETFRKKKDGSLIEVALTLSPIKDVAGEIIGISGISKDISDKKRVEKELIRRNQELSRLFLISSAMRGTLDLDRLLRMVLTAVTMSDGLGFNRAILFLLDEDRNALKGVMGVGPSSPEEAWRVWESLSTEKRTLRDIMIDLEQEPISKNSFLDKLSVGMEISMDEATALTKAVKEKVSVNIMDVRSEPLFDPVLVQQLGTEAYAAVPLVSRDKVIGLIWVDNIFNRKPITEEDMRFLEGFADQVASAIEAARLFQKVSLAEAELENIFRSISDMVFITDKDYVVKNANQAVVERIGMQREDIIGKKCYKIFHGMDSPWHSCPHHKTMETMRAYVEELEDPHLQGTFLTSTSPVFDRDRQFLGTVHVARDISELKQLRIKLQSAERMAALGEVAAKVAHEIRNPLVSVGGFAKRLESKLDGDLQEYARIIANEVKRLEAILKDILGFVREVRMSVKTVDLNEIARDIVGLLKEELSASGNKVDLDLYDPALMVQVDFDRIKEALINVLSNANQATDGGKITIRTFPRDGVGVMEVSDTGCGMNPGDVARIFDPFFTTRPTGTGLGLAIAKRILEEHHGNIYVESTKPGEGTKFAITLPLKEDNG